MNREFNTRSSVFLFCFHGSYLLEEKPCERASSLHCAWQKHLVLMASDHLLQCWGAELTTQADLHIAHIVILTYMWKYLFEYSACVRFMVL